MKNICIQGLGFVGAAMAVGIAAARDQAGAPVFKVTGVDLPNALGQDRVDKLNRGEFPFGTSDALLIKETQNAHKTGNLRATTDESVYEQADIVLVNVHLDVDTNDDLPKVDMTHFRRAIRTIGDRIKQDTLVIIETTVPPGTCAHVVVPELEQAFAKRGLSNDSFLLAHSYERVMPGEDYLNSITNFWRVYSGHTAAAADACEAFLTHVINTKDYPLTRLESTTASELSKVMENSYRSANIAFIEEWARFAEQIDVDLFAVINAIRMRPTHSNIRQPGFGVGGYCLTKDPLFPGVAARDIFGLQDISFPISENAIKINNVMPLVSVERLEKMLGGNMTDKRILLMGVTYRQDVADTRYSASEIFAREVLARGAKIIAHDPYIKHWDELSMDIETQLPRADEVDAVLMAVSHKDYSTLELHSWLAGTSTVVLDANNVLSAQQRKALDDANIPNASIGRGDKH